MSKYIPAEKLIAEIERLAETLPEVRSTMEELLSFINSLQQKQPIEGKQVIIITETDGDANIHWDCRSLDDVKALLASAQSFIADKQVEELQGQGSGPDYNTTEGRYSHLFKRQQEQPEVDLRTEYDEQFYSDPVFGKLVNRNAGIAIARHFYELGLNARKEE